MHFAIMAGKVNPVRVDGYSLHDYGIQIIDTNYYKKPLEDVGVAYIKATEHGLEIHVANEYDGEIQIFVDKPNCSIKVNDEEV